MSVADTGIFSDPSARGLTLELVRVTEHAAVAAARLRGQGKEKEADQAAVDAMRDELRALPIDGQARDLSGIGSPSCRRNGVFGFDLLHGIP